MKKTEFGKGYSYCLGLFLIHCERKQPDKKDLDAYYMNTFGERGLWFNGAADHIREFDAKTKRDHKFRDFCLERSRGMATEADFEWARKEALALLRIYDNKNGHTSIQGEWE
jgi:hypothetical protein